MVYTGSLNLLSKDVQVRILYGTHWRDMGSIPIASLLVPWNLKYSLRLLIHGLIIRKDTPNALVAQLVEALVLGTRCCEFESHQVYSHYQLIDQICVQVNVTDSLWASSSVGSSRGLLIPRSQVQILSSPQIRLKLNWMSGGLRNRRLQVRLLSGVPAYSISKDV